MDAVPTESPHDDAQQPSSGLAALVRSRPVVAAITAALVAAVVTLGVVAILFSVVRSPVAAPSSPAPSWQAGAEKVSVFLKLDATEEQKSAIESALRKLPSIKEFRFRSRQEAYAEFKELYKDQPGLVAMTKPESFPEAFLVTLKDPSGFCDVARLRDVPGVDTVTGPADRKFACR